MNIAAARQYGSQSMAAPMRRVPMRAIGSAMKDTDSKRWHCRPGFDAAKSGRQHQELVRLVVSEDGLAHTVFMHDSSLMTGFGGPACLTRPFLRG